MSQQQFPLEQDTVPIWICTQSASGEVVPILVGYYNQYPWLPSQHPSHSYEGIYSDVSHFQYNATFQDIGFTGVTNYSQAGDHQPLVTPFLDPTPSLSTQTLNSYDSSAELLPTSPSSASVSSSSSVGKVNPDICRQALPYEDEETKQWSCGGCNKAFSDKYGAERHIANVGRKVTCRYCGSRISALESSRRRHFRRETCRRKGIRRGFTTRNEEDAFLE